MSTTRRFLLSGGRTWSATFADVGPGLSFDLSALTVRDIAHNLSYVNRFSGAAGYCTVAEHSVKLARFVDGTPSQTLQCLLHDAGEAMGCADTNGWLKKTFAPGLRTYEAAAVNAVWRRLVDPVPPDWSWLKPYDGTLGDWEALRLGFPTEWGDDEPLNECCDPEHWVPGRAEYEFLSAWGQTGGKL